MKQTLTLRLQAATSETGVDWLWNNCIVSSDSRRGARSQILVETFRRVHRGFEAHLASIERDPQRKRNERLTRQLRTAVFLVFNCIAIGRISRSPMAPSSRTGAGRRCPISRAKPTSRGHMSTAAFDPNATCRWAIDWRPNGPDSSSTAVRRRHLRCGRHHLKPAA
jgi:hypothetical protein